MDLVYHHTTTDGLIGIIGNGALWATDIHFLNDYDEYIAGFERIIQVCEDNKSGNHKDELADAFDLFYDMVPDFIKTNIEIRSTFIASFTKTRDNLRQWMSYGKPNSSYSIGFDAEALKNISLDKEKHRSDELTYAFKEVDYEFDSLIEPLLNRKSLTNTLKGMDLMQCATNLASELMFGCCAVKRKEFKDESESRMVLQTRKPGETFSGVKFRNSGGVVTPHIEVPIPLSAIREIIIGPNINKEIAKRGLDNIMAHKKINCEVSHSECTLRQY